MEGAPAKAKGRRRPARKQQEGSAAAAVGAAPAAARPAATGATEATEHTEGEDGAGTQQQQQPQPSLSQRLARSLKQLSQLGAGSNIQGGGDEGVVEQEQLLRYGGQAGEPAPPGGGDQQEQEESGDEGQEEGGRAGGGARRAAALGRAVRRRLQGLLPRGRVPKLSSASMGASSWRAAAAVVALVLLLLSGQWASRAARAHQGQLAALAEQLANERQVAAATSTALQHQLADLQRQVIKQGRQLAASSSALAVLQHHDGEQAAAAAQLEVGLGAVHDDIVALQLAAAAGAAAAAPPNATADHWQRLRQLVREEAEGALQLFAADRTGLPDYALAAAGGAVVAHSPAHPPPARAGGLASSLAAKLHSSGVHPQANRLLLAPVAGPGNCLPLVGASGWVDVRLAAPIHPTAFSYEHIPASIAYDISSAPRGLALTGFLGPPPPPGSGSGEGGRRPPGVPLGQFEFDGRGGRSVQTFPLAAGALPPGASVDHVRLAITSNHGHLGFTCVYRLRVHGTPVAAMPAAAAATA